MEPNGAPPGQATAGHRFGQIPQPSPRGGGGHRRALSETVLRLPDDLLFDTDQDFGISDIDFPSLSDDNLSGGCGAVAAEPGMSDPAAATSGRPVPGAHQRSLSVDGGIFDGLGFQAGAASGGSSAGGGEQERRGHHRRKNLKAHGLMSDSLIMQRDTTDLTAENRELKLRLQAMEQQAQLRDGMCSTIH
ncbi:hypothetical protein GW17_00003140 [Ensete ventricosum]|nr:hypothetical protein GW17_00003140 [Ensete ventricosum]